MDTRFLNFHGGEQFSTFNSTYFLDPSGDESQTSEDTNNPRCSWDWDRERELNGDIGLIPITNNTNGDFCVLSTSPPSKEDFHKIMCDWQQLVNVELEDIEELAIGMLGDDPEHSELKKQSSSENLSEPISVFSDSSSSQVDSVQELMHNNVEQISDFENGPSLKDGDAENVRNENVKKDFSTHTFKKRQISYGGKKIDMKNQRYVLDTDSDEDSDEDSHVDVETLSDISSNEKAFTEITEDILPVEHHVYDLPASSGAPAVNNRELEKVTPPTPNNLRKLVQGQTLVESNYNESGESSFCTTSLERKKESGYWKGSENELNSQVLPNSQCDEKSSPAIEAGDLKSLLEQFEAKEYETQQNHDSYCAENIVENKKIISKTPFPLQLTKCKSQTNKRKSRILVSNKVRENIVSVSSNLVYLDHNYCISSSPRKDSDFSSCDEDDQTVLHSQPTVKTADGKLMVSLLKINTIKKRKLNLEEYKQLRKDRRSNYTPSAYKDENARRLRKMCVQPLPTPNIEIKTLVSIGVNTDQSWGRLQELVSGCQEVNFGINSFITSLVENLPKNEKSVEYGEDKTIVYLDKDRAEAPKTANKFSQTSFEERSPSRTSSCSSSSSRSASKSPPPRKRRNSLERMREVEERRVIYVGRIGDFMTRDDLRKRFEQFGPISNVSVHFRKSGDNYGFVTFKHRQDAYEAVEHGNDDITQPQYDLSFGGRRIFCQTSYSDLDNVQDEEMYPLAQTSNDTFDVLLREVRAKLMRNKKEF